MGLTVLPSRVTTSLSATGNPGSRTVLLLTVTLPALTASAALRRDIIPEDAKYLVKFTI